MSESSNIDISSFFEVLVPDVDGGEWVYWVESDDLDFAVETALDKHLELGRPEVLDDEEGGSFPMAYQPVIEGNRDDAVIIAANQK